MTYMTLPAIVTTRLVFESKLLSQHTSNADNGLIIEQQRRAILVRCGQVANDAPSPGLHCSFSSASSVVLKR